MEMENELLQPLLAVPWFWSVLQRITEHEEAWWLWKPAPEWLWTYFALHPTHFQSIELPDKHLLLDCLDAPGSILAHRAGSGKQDPCSCCGEHTLSPGRRCAYRLPGGKTVKSALEGGVGIVNIVSRDFWGSLSALCDLVQFLLHCCLPTALPWCGWKEKHVVCQVQLLERARPSLFWEKHACILIGEARRRGVELGCAAIKG